MPLRPASSPAVKEGVDKPVSETTYRHLAGFRSEIRKFLNFSESAATALGVTTQQYQAILAIRAAAGREMSIKALSEELLLLPHGAVQLVDRLRRLGLVRRKQSQIDRRSVLVRLTPTGDRLVERLAAAHMRELSSHVAHLETSVRRLKTALR